MRHRRVQVDKLAACVLAFCCAVPTRPPAADLTKQGMRNGIEGCGVFLLFLSSGCLAREYVQFELETALELEKPILLVHEIDKNDQRFDFVGVWQLELFG